MQLAIASGSTRMDRARRDDHWTATAKVRGAPRAPTEAGAVAYAHGMIEYAAGLLQPYDWDRTRRAQV